MSRISSIDRARSQIAHYFDSQPRRIYRIEEFSPILWRQRTSWKLVSSTTVGALIKKLLEWGDMKEISLLPLVQSSLYIWRTASPYEVASALFRNGYLTHASALYIHGLTNEITKTIYVNNEQSRKAARPRPDLSQGEIDEAFSRPQREAGISALYEKHRIVVIHGQWTGHLEVIHAISPDGAPVRVTSIERTLVDCVVRPAYAGGPHNVLNAFEAAKDKIAVIKLKAILSRLGFRYPYQQSVGFLLQRAGYPEKSWKPFLEPAPKINFYLAYGLNDAQFDEKWKLYFPKSL